jgi:nitric oxide reductase activation protein
LPLHRPLPEKEAMSQRYRGTDGMPVSVEVSLPLNRVPPPELGARRERHRQIASMMAKPLKAIREQAEQRLRRLPEGRLDRRQLVNAVKGLDDVYTATKERPRTSFAASVSVDMSGSMGDHIKKMELYDAVMVLGDTFEMIVVPHEVRAFGSSTAQVKAMDEPLDPRRAAFLAASSLGLTSFNDTAGLGQSSLLAREERNRMMICLSDGNLDDHEASARTLRQARQNGIVTFGIFLGLGGDTDKLDELYGKGNWTRIQALSDMPKAVAQRLASIFKSMR